MIKNLLNADEDPPPGTKVIIEETVLVPPSEAPAAESPAAENAAASPETGGTREFYEDAQLFTAPAATAGETLDEDSESYSALVAELENLAPEDLKALEAGLENPPAAEPLPETSGASAETPVPSPVRLEKEPVAEPPETANQAESPVDRLPSGTLFQTEAPPPSMGETIRQSGLAYSAAIVLVGSVVFTMILGWFADLLLGSSPWGIVGGIILGGIIGFIQFFRITSQIFKK